MILSPFNPPPPLKKTPSSYFGILNNEVATPLYHVDCGRCFEHGCIVAQFIKDNKDEPYMEVCRGILDSWGVEKMMHYKPLQLAMMEHGYAETVSYFQDRFPKKAMALMDDFLVRTFDTVGLAGGDEISKYPNLSVPNLADMADIGSVTDIKSAAHIPPVFKIPMKKTKKRALAATYMVENIDGISRTLFA